MFPPITKVTKVTKVTFPHLYLFQIKLQCPPLMSFEPMRMRVATLGTSVTPDISWQVDFFLILGRAPWRLFVCWLPWAPIPG